MNDVAGIGELFEYWFFAERVAGFIVFAVSDVINIVGRYERRVGIDMIDNFSVILPLQSFVKIVIAYQVVYDVFKNYVEVLDKEIVADSSGWIYRVGTGEVAMA